MWNYADSFLCLQSNAMWMPPVSHSTLFFYKILNFACVSFKEMSHQFDAIKSESPFKLF